MSDTNFPISADDDLPRTFRRARQEREAALKEAAQQDAATQPATLHDPMAGAPIPPPSAAYDNAPKFDQFQMNGKPHVVVRELRVPFFQLVAFFIKAVFAAIPALIILGGLIWLGGEFLTNTFPELLKMKILIQFPN